MCLVSEPTAETRAARCTAGLPSPQVGFSSETLQSLQPPPHPPSAQAMGHMETQRTAALHLPPCTYTALCRRLVLEKCPATPDSCIATALSFT